jgi:hypothetical protein
LGAGLGAGLESGAIGCLAAGSTAQQNEAQPLRPLESGTIGFVDDFDDCQPSCSSCQGWGNICELLVSTPPAHSAPNAVRLDGLLVTDLVKPVGYRAGMSGKFIISAWTYVPEHASGSGYFIGFHTFDIATPCADWSLQVEFDEFFETVHNDASGLTGASLPLVKDQWTRYIAIVDLEADRYWDYYAGDPLTSEYQGQPLGWVTNNALRTRPVCGGHPPTIAAVNLFSNGIDGQLFDDVSVLCYADQDTSTGIGVLDVFDFLAFQDAFVTGDMSADCDISSGHGVLDVLDYMCFQEAFIAGCP